MFLSTANRCHRIAEKAQQYFAGEMQTSQGGEVRVLVDQDYFGGDLCLERHDLYDRALVVLSLNASKDLIVVYEAIWLESIQEMGCVQM